MSISLILEMAVSDTPDRIALSVDDVSLTYRQFADLVGGVGSVLIESGAESVVFLGGSGVELPVLLFAAAHAGIPFTPVNYRLASGALEAMISRVDGALVVVDRAYANSVAGVDAPVEYTDDLFARGREHSATPLPAADVDPDSPAIVLFTSGTTSEPKGVILRHSHLLSYVMSTVEFASADPADGALISVPPYHVAGMGTIVSNFYACRRMIYLANFDAAEWVRIAREQGATSAMVVPTMLDRIVDHLGSAQVDIPTLKSLSYGGARMPRPTLEAALRAFPGVGFVNAYGLTETSSTIALLGPEDHWTALESDDPVVAARLGSIGRPVPGIEIEIRDGEDRVVPVGEQGELWVRGPQVSGEYMGSGSVLDRQGWFATRDIAYQDVDDFLFVVGRNDDTIIRGGENIAPAEIEDVLVEHPLVHSVAVVGIPDDHWGQAIVATIVLEPGATASQEELRDHVRDRLRSSRTPDRIVFRAELPSTLTGKILRKNIIADILASAEVAPV